MQDIFVKRLVALMEEKNMTGLELSKLIGTTNVTISRYVNGQRKPRLEIVVKIAEALGTTTDYLLGYSNIKNFTSSKTGNVAKIYNKLEDLNLLNSNNELSDAQVAIIEKLIDANQDFIKHFKDDSLDA